MTGLIVLGATIALGLGLLAWDSWRHKALNAGRELDEDDESWIPVTGPDDVGDGGGGDGGGGDGGGGDGGGD